MNDRTDHDDDDDDDDEPWCEHFDRVGDRCRQCETETEAEARTEARTEGYRF